MTDGQSSGDQSQGSNQSNQPKLRRSLTAADYFMLSITGMIGSAWLFTPLGAAGAMGPAAILSWVIAGLFFIFMVFPFAELGGLFPFSGSLARYNHYSHGVLSNYVLAWTYTLGAITTLSSEAIAIVEYASDYIPEFWNPKLNVLTPIGILVAAALIAFFFLVQVTGVNVYGWFNRVITAWKFIIPILTAALLMGLYMHPSYVIGKLPGGFAPYGYAAIFTGMITTGVVYAYEGFRQGLEYAGEGKNPQRDVPMGTILAVAVTIIMYVLLQMAFLGAVNWSAAGVSPGDWQALASGSWSAHPFASEAMAIGIPILTGLAVILLVDAAISPAGTLAVYVGTSGRNLYGMARIGYIPQFFAQIHERFQTPWIALLASSVLALIFLAPFPTWYAIMSYSAVVTVYGYLEVGVTNHALRRLAPELKRAYKPWAWQVIYPISFVVASLLIYWSSWSYVNPIIISAVVGLPLLMLGPYRKKLGMSIGETAAFSAIYWISVSLTVAAWYMGWLSGLGSMTSFAVYWAALSGEQVMAFLYLWLRTRHPDIKGASWIVLYNVLLGIVSYMGSLGPLSSPLINYPWDYLAWAAISLVVYAYAINVAYMTTDLKQVKESGIPVE